MELLKYVYLYAQKSIIKAGNNKFQDLINAPRKYHWGNSGKILCVLALCIAFMATDINLSRIVTSQNINQQLA